MVVLKVIFLLSKNLIDPSVVKVSLIIYFIWKIFVFLYCFILFLHSILSFEILYLYLHKKEKPPFFYGGSVIYTYYIDNKSKVFILLLLLSI